MKHFERLENVEVKKQSKRKQKENGARKKQEQEKQQKTISEIYEFFIKLPETGSQTVVARFQSERISGLFPT